MPRPRLFVFLSLLLLFDSTQGQQRDWMNNNNNFLPGRGGALLQAKQPPPLPPAALEKQQQEVALAAVTKSTVIAGKVRCFFNKLRRMDLSQVHLGMNGALDWGDLVWLAAVGYWTEPLARWVYTWTHRNDNNNNNNGNDTTTIDQAYQQTWICRIASTVGELGRVVGLVYVTDIATLALRKMGFALPDGVNKRLANLIYALFGANKVRQAKHWWLRRWFGKQPDTALTGREKVLDMIVDGTIGFLLFFMIQDIFSVTMGRSLQSLFAIGGISGIMISLASKDLAQLLLSGFVIRSSDKYVEGESIKLGDGTTGTITHLGAFEMHIRGGDGIVTRIPNVQIVNQRVQTLSRMTESQVKQTLWFRYDDIDKIPAILQSIESEIKLACGGGNDDTDSKLLSVKALWTEFKEDHLEAVVSAQFKIAPTSSEYGVTKQKMLKAIAQAVHKNNVEFAIPTSICKNENIVKD